ncbi:MAG TPA: sulfatase-like hydrolase/transferase [Thermoanaerobaculia bacterium]|nr:sulfatase-like hydrolase/transferase [Thermoanaerobaculia bacterium]
MLRCSESSRRPARLRGAWTTACATLLVVAGLPALAGCGAGAGPPDELAADARRWARVGSAWVHGIAIEGGGSLEPGRGGELRALVVPGDGLRELRAAVDGGRASAVLRFAPGDARAQALRLRVPAGATVRFETDGPTTLVRPRLVDKTSPPRRVVLIVADTLRADHATPELMGELLSRFEGGLLAELAFAAGSWTLPSIAALFAGELPTRLRAPDGSLISLADSVDTLAERLAAQGFVNVAVVANPTVNHENGFSQGFDLFHVPRVAAPEAKLDARWVAERAREAALALAEDDLFLYLHFMEPHDPYRNHESGESLVPPPLGAGVSEERLAVLAAAYASEVRSLSVELALLLDDLGPLDLVVFTSDHGEELLDHGGMKHGPTVFPEVTHVPLWIAGREVPQVRRRIAPGRLTEPVSQVELAELFAGSGPWPRSDSVTVETFAHAPPRWGWVERESEWIVAARDLPAGELDAIGSWLRSALPALMREPLGDADHDRTHAGALPELPPHVLAALVEQYQGFAAGIWLAGRGEPLDLEIARGGPLRCWLGCERVEVAIAGDGARRLSVRSGEQAVVLFVPRGDAARGPLRGLELGPRPVAVPGRGWAAWEDEGRPAQTLRGIEQTLERLEALGYIER